MNRLKFLLLLLVFAIPSFAQSLITKTEKLVNASVDAKGELTITASEKSSPRDFDFMVGKWKLYNKRLKTRLSNATEWETTEASVENQPLLNGIGNRDLYQGAYEGIEMRLFNPKTRLWTMYWADSNNGTLDTPMTGSFEGNIGTFYGKDMLNGKPILVMWTWDKTDIDNTVWKQAYSQDNGKTWEWNFDSLSKRVNPDNPLQGKAWITKNEKMVNAVVNEKGELIITPSKNSSVTDFDYLEGRWTMDNTKLKSRLTNCTEWTQFTSTDETMKILKGTGNTDVYRTTVDGKPYEGVTLRLFNPKTRLWSIYWVDSNIGVMDPPMVGSFEGNIGTFYCKDVYKDIPILVVFRWDKTDPDNPVWAQAFSTDNGVTWEWNFTNTSHRIK